MARLADLLASLRGKGEKALAVYIMGGDPSLEFTQAAVPALAEAGADIVEVGIPFSDPLADGPTIQAAGQRALSAGTTPTQVLDTLACVRQRTSAGLVVMTYYNLVYVFGL